jgi:hypothetical protein
MTISNEAVDAVCAAHVTILPREAIRSILEAAAGIIRAECLEEAADHAFKDKKIQGLQRVLIGNYLRARAVAERGEG